MNKIEFKTLEIQNFFSFTDNQIFKFPESGLFLIRGENHDFQMNVFSDDIKKMNGCGKSSIIKALNWVIFGENPDKKIKADGLINKKNKKNLLVKVNFKLGNDEWKIERYRKLTSKGNGLDLFRLDNGVWIDESFADIKLTQEKINNLISLNHETLLHSVTLTKETNSNFIELPWNQRSIFLENIVRLDKLRDYGKIVKEKLSANRKERDFLEKEKYAHNTTIKSLNGIIKNLIINKRNSIKNNGLEISKAESELELLLKNSNIEIINNFIEYVKLNKFISEHESSNKKNKMELNNNLDQYRRNKKDIFSIIEKINESCKIKTEQCSHCDKNIEIKVRKDVIDSFNYSLNKSRENLVLIRKNIKNNIFIKKKKDQEKEVLDNKLLSFDKNSFSTIDKPFKEIIINDIMNNKDPHLHLEGANKLNDKIKELKSKKIIISDIWDNIKNIRDHKKIIQDNESKLEKINHLIMIGEFWDAALDFRNEGSLKSYIMSKIVPIFNAILKSIVDIIFEGKIEIIFDNSWNETIIYEGEEFDYSQLSMGEKAQVNLSISLSLFSILRINVGGTNILFLDEIFSSMDEDSIEKFIEIFRSSFVKEKMSIFIISHESGIKNFVPDGLIKVIKKNKESRIYYN
jgi:DNA repair exonuclease SbcCD ATPase subunit